LFACHGISIHLRNSKENVDVRASKHLPPRRKRRDETEYECRASAFRGPRYFRNFPIPPLTLSTFLRRPLSVPPLSSTSTISFSRSLGRDADDTLIPTTHAQRTSFLSSKERNLSILVRISQIRMVRKRKQ